MKKKLKIVMLTMLIAVNAFVAISVFASSDPEVYTEGNYTYIVEDGEALITDFNDSVTGAITIPSTLGGYPVTNIGMWAFNACTGLTSVTIPDSVTNIGIEAFYWCKGLKSVTIPDSVRCIEYGAFRSCFALESITIPDSVTIIGGSAFRSCDKLKSVSIGNGVTTIGNGAFNWCESLTSIDIPDSVITIENGAFFNSGLTTITVGSGVNSIEENVFGGCIMLASIYVDRENESYCSVDGVLFDKNMTEIIVYPRKKVDTEYKIPDGVTAVHTNAFSGCSNLASIEIPAGVTYIGYGAFSDCKGLISVTIPSSVTTIEERAFYNCSNLKDVYFIETKEKWDGISIGSSNNCLTDATIHCIKPYTHTSVAEGVGCKVYQVEYYWVPAGSAVAIACYNGDALAHLEVKCDNNESFTVSNDITYDKVKIFVWNSLTNMRPITYGEDV